MTETLPIQPIWRAIPIVITTLKNHNSLIILSKINSNFHQSTSLIFLLSSRQLFAIKVGYPFNPNVSVFLPFPHSAWAMSTTPTFQSYRATTHSRDIVSFMAPDQYIRWQWVKTCLWSIKPSYIQGHQNTATSMLIILHRMKEHIILISVSRNIIIVVSYEMLQT